MRIFKRKRKAYCYDTWNSLSLSRSFKLLEAYEKGIPLWSQPENVMFLNSLQVKCAEQYIFSQKNDFSLASEMVSSHEDIHSGVFGGK